MSDLISRADAIEAVKHSTAYMHDDLYEAISIRIPSAETTGALDDAIAKYVADGLMELPSAEAEWIPVSEGLPSDSGNYLITVADFRLGHIGEYTVTTADFYAKGKKWNSVVDVVAWMPLPKPYREESEVEE